MEINERLTITEVASQIGISTKTLVRWEKDGKVTKPKRDWRGWRVYNNNDVRKIKDFHEALFE
ncbi:MAG: MerR family transcriptional regulator [Candidatus Omnitrophica bacterium]|nr:MerR family transcriptional regulator [Candidatus Omnitrophota bacterium]